MTKDVRYVHLFQPLKLRSLQLKNRIAMSPMCQYSAQDGYANDWHCLHLGTRAVGGAGLVFVEATAVEARGRISPYDLGLWSDVHIAPLARIAQLVESQGAAAGIQLAHAGRKASTGRPWEGRAPLDEIHGGWSGIVAPSAIAYDDDHAEPLELSVQEIEEVIDAFGLAAERAHSAGFRVLEIHGAHGYLIHEFLSPLANERKDEYGGSFENRIRFLQRVVGSVRDRWPDELPLFLRISTTDWFEEGWDLEQSIELARRADAWGVDLIDCSSGGIAPGATIPIGAGYQTEQAARIRAEAGVKTGAVGLITSAQQADHIIRSRQADLVLLGRELLRNPYWPLRASQEIGQEAAWPVQYERSK